MKITSNINAYLQILFINVICQGLEVNGFSIYFIPNNTITIHVDDSVSVKYNITNVTDTEVSGEFLFESEDDNVVSLDRNVILSNHQRNSTGFFNITGIFLGQTKIICRNKKTNEIIAGNMEVIVVRKHRLIDTLFTISVAAFVSIIYINFGCALNWPELINLLKKPVGPAIGFCGQFILMPSLSYGLGQILFPDSPEMQLGIFFTGVAPGGGASNVWTLLLDGNVSLSIIMTTVSTFAAFAMMPLWIFTLGKIIFNNGNLDVPYFQITIYIVALVIPLGIGFLIQKYFKRFATFMEKILKGFSICLTIFIIVFATVTNLYLFKLFSWKIVVAGMALPWFGYILGYFIARLLRQPSPDCLTIAIEIGIQNTGIPIFLLRLALPQPQADLTTIAPVAVAVLTPLPLVILYIYTRLEHYKSTW